jgi:hypothetical protein
MKELLNLIKRIVFRAEVLNSERASIYLSDRAVPPTSSNAEPFLLYLSYFYNFHYSNEKAWQYKFMIGESRIIAFADLHYDLSTFSCIQRHKLLFTK